MSERSLRLDWDGAGAALDAPRSRSGKNPTRNPPGRQSRLERKGRIRRREMLKDAMKLERWVAVISVLLLLALAGPGWR